MFIEIKRSNGTKIAINTDKVERISEMGNRTVITMSHSDSTRQSQYVVSIPFWKVMEMIRIHIKTETLDEIKEEE